jgi:hypothetical protein
MESDLIFPESGGDFNTDPRMFIGEMGGDSAG